MLSRQELSSYQQPLVEYVQLFLIKLRKLWNVVVHFHKLKLLLG